MEFRLGEAGTDAMGFAVHVPHYLARAEYPQAARVLLDHVGLAAGLYLPTESLSKAAERADAEIAEQVEGSEEVRQVVEALERQYDMVAAGRGERGGSAWAASCPAPTSWPPRWSASSPGTEEEDDDPRATPPRERGPARWTPGGPDGRGSGRRRISQPLQPVVAVGDGDVGAGTAVHRPLPTSPFVLTRSLPAPASTTSSPTCGQRSERRHGLTPVLWGPTWTTVVVPRTE